jgi:hypothetical protein
MMKRPVFCIVLWAGWLATSFASAAEVRHELGFPNLGEYQTLACDPHMHTVFSDGLVWPTVRVAEAWRQGLHAISITDHIEYAPHKLDVPVNHNRPYELAVETAKAHGMMLVRGAEITRDTPPGHFNAIFLDDVEPLDTPELLDAIKAANDQGAFVFWNHQAWKGEEKGKWLDVHTTMYDNQWLHGMEVCNGDGYHPSAHKWCLEKNLTMLGSSDIHDADPRQKSTHDDHRTLTLALVKDRTPDGLKAALRERRTLVWFQDQLIGREEWLRPMFEASLTTTINHRTKTVVWLELRNACDADMRLQRTGKVGPTEIVVPARAIALVRVTVADSSKPHELHYTVANWLVAPAKGLPVKLTLRAP